MKPFVVEGLPICSEDECPEYDGKRCRLTGTRPYYLCQPYVVEMSTKLEKAQAWAQCKEHEGAHSMQLPCGCRITPASGG